MSGELTAWLQRMHEGDPVALERVVRMLYDELRQIARQRLRLERGAHTLSATALVHEAFLRLARQHQLPAGSRTQFLAAASNTMRRVLVDYARTRNRVKRGGGVAPVPLEEAEAFLTDDEADEILALEEALERLAQAEPRAAQVVEHRFFSGLSVEEIAQHLGVSSKTIQRDWILARAWLRREVAQSLPLPD
jgi:RNA polymerase sigma factor (TIGR02999 family)